jgi:hypothetical protein
MNRTIASRARTSTLELADVLSSIFALELLAPSPVIYLVSPWISDVQLLQSRFGRYRGLKPDSARGVLTLADILNELAERPLLSEPSSHPSIRIIYRSNATGVESFLGRLSSRVQRRSAAHLHEKGLLTRRCYLRGSMNFTFSGINLNDEHVELTTEQAQIAQAELSMRELWERAQ